MLPRTSKDKFAHTLITTSQARHICKEQIVFIQHVLNNKMLIFVRKVCEQVKRKCLMFYLDCARISASPNSRSGVNTPAFDLLPYLTDGR